MNSFYRQMNSLLFFAAVVVTIPAYSMENEDVAVDVSEQQTEMVPAVWYKQHSVQIAAVAMTTAVALYAFAVHKGKILSPVVLAGIFFAKFAQQAAQPNAQNGNVSGNNQISATNDDSCVSLVGTQDANVQKKTVTSEAVQQPAHQLDAMVAFLNKCKATVMQTTDEDLRDRHLNAFNQ